MTELRAPQLTADEAIRRIAADIKAYPQGGDKREEHLRLYSTLVPPEEIEALWAERYAEVERQAKAEAAPKFERREFTQEQIERWQAERASFLYPWHNQKQRQS